MRLRQAGRIEHETRCACRRLGCGLRRGCRHRSLCGCRGCLVRRHRRRRLAGAPQLDGRRGAYFQSPLIQVGHITRANDVRDQGKHNLVFLVLDVALGKEVFQNRNLRQPWDAVQRADVLVLQNSAQDIHFAFLQADFMFNLALADHRLADAANVRLPGHRGNIHQDLQRDFAAGMHLGRDVNVHADIGVLKLGIDERIDAHAADAGLK